jgi:hypothetical protein
VELVSRRVLGVAVEDVSSNESGFADAIEELVAALVGGLLVTRGGMRGHGSDGRRGQEEDEKQAVHARKDTCGSGRRWGVGTS